MMPVHHVPEEWLFDYASGALPEGVALVVATHCALCPVCRGQVEEFERLGASLMQTLDASPLGSDAESQLLAKLAMEPAPAPAPVQEAGPFVLPQPLRGYTGPLSTIRFKHTLPQLGQIDLPIAHSGPPVQLVHLKAGWSVPRHQHEGVERTLVLTGGFTDNYAQYGPGDLSVRGPGEDHLQHIDKGEPCIALVVNDHKLIPRTLMGKVARLLTGL